jgi:hypothetical protein
MTSVLVIQLISSVAVGKKHYMLGPYIFFMFGYTAMFLSLTQCVVIELSRRVAETAQKVFRPYSSTSSTVKAHGMKAVVRLTSTLVALATRRGATMPTQKGGGNMVPHLGGDHLRPPCDILPLITGG